MSWARTVSMSRAIAPSTKKSNPSSEAARASALKRSSSGVSFPDKSSEVRIIDNLRRLDIAVVAARHQVGIDEERRHRVRVRAFKRPELFEYFDVAFGVAP